MSRMFFNEIISDIKGKRIGKIFVIVLLYGLVLIWRKPEQFDFGDYQMEFFRGVLYASVFLAAYLLTYSFEKGNIKYQLHDVIRREKIWSIKILSMLSYSVLFWIISLIFSVMLKFMGIRCVWDNIFSVDRLILYIVVISVIFAYGYLLTLLLKNVFLVEILMIALWVVPYQVLPFFLYGINIENIISEKFMQLVHYFPQIIIVKWVSDNKIDFRFFIIMILHIVILQFIAKKIFCNKEI